MTSYQVQPHEDVVSFPREDSIWDRIRRHRWFLITVVVPTLLAIVYYGLIASDIYVSESRFVIKSPDRKQAQLSTLANLIQTTGLSAGQEQTNEVIDYLRSRNALADLSKQVDVVAVFTNPQADGFSRFPGIWSDRSNENLHRYYDKMVDIHIDHDTSNAVLEVKAFQARDAYRLNESLLKLSETLVNRLNARASSRAIAEAQERAKIAENRVRAARVELARYRNSSQLLDPEQQGKGVLEISNALIARRASLQAQLATIAQAAPSNPALPALRQQIAALTAQIEAQNSRAVGGSSGIASKLSGYEALAVEQEFATEMLTAASASLEQARADALRQKFYLERIVEPNVPDKAMLPSRLKQILTVLGVSLCLYLVGWMLIVGILEHAPEDR